MEEKIEKPTLGQLWQDIKKHKKLYYKVLGITFFVSAIITLSIPNYYQCTVMLAPELNGAKSGGGLSSLASSFGINLGNANPGADAINPTLYPDLMNSVTFKASLFPVKVQRDKEDSTMTYYDYLQNHQKQPWWTSAKKALFSLFAVPEPVEGTVNPFRLTPEQAGVIDVMNTKVFCDVDMTTNVITIVVTDQDPLIAATMADSVQVHLQDFITDYRTKKARVDLAYNQKLFTETKARYEKARKQYAGFSDANQRVFLESVQSQKSALENEMQLQYQAYSQVSAQLLAAEAKVQQDTPAFTLLQPATVPIRKAGPKRASTCLVIIFLALLATTLWSINHEGHLFSLFRTSGTNNDVIDDDDVFRALLKLATPEKTEK